MKKEGNLKMYTTPSEDRTVFSETMGDDWISKQDNYFDIYQESGDENSISNFNMFEFITEAFFNFF